MESTITVEGRSVGNVDGGRSNESRDAEESQWCRNYIICLPVSGTCRFNGRVERVYYARRYAYVAPPRVANTRIAHQKD